MRRAKTSNKINKRIRGFRRKKTAWRTKALWLIIIFALLAAGFFYLIVLSPFLQIKNVNVSGGQKIANDTLRVAIEEKLSRRILFWQTQSIFLIDTKAISRELLLKFPGLREIKIKRDLPDQLLSQAVERSGLARICGPNQCYLIDEQGVIFELSSSQASQPSLLLQDPNELPSGLGAPVISAQDMANILNIARAVSERFNIDILKIIIEEQQLTVKTKTGWEIYFDPKADVEKQIFNLSAVLDKQLPPQKRTGLEYIDLRFGNKVYYK